MLRLEPERHLVRRLGGLGPAAFPWRHRGEVRLGLEELAEPPAGRRGGGFRFRWAPPPAHREPSFEQPAGLVGVFEGRLEHDGRQPGLTGPLRGLHLGPQGGVGLDIIRPGHPLPEGAGADPGPGGRCRSRQPAPEPREDLLLDLRGERGGPPAGHGAPNSAPPSAPSSARRSSSSPSPSSPSPSEGGRRRPVDLLGQEADIPDDDGGLREDEPPLPLDADRSRSMASSSSYTSRSASRGGALGAGAGRPSPSKGWRVLPWRFGELGAAVMPPALRWR